MNRRELLKAGGYGLVSAVSARVGVSEVRKREEISSLTKELQAMEMSPEYNESDHLGNTTLFDQTLLKFRKLHGTEGIFDASVDITLGFTASLYFGSKAIEVFTEAFKE